MAITIKNINKWEENGKVKKSEKTMKWANSLFIKCIFIYLVLIVIQGCETPNLHNALATGDQEAIMVSLRRGADPNELNSEGLSPLHVAILRHDTNTVKILLEYGADVYKTDINGQSALGTALNECIGRDSLGSLTPRKWDLDHPAVQVVSTLMTRVRGRTHKEIDTEGTLSIYVEIGERTSKGRELILHLAFATSEENYRLSLSRLETEYVNVEQFKRGTILLKSNQTYRVMGALKDGQIEATLISFLGKESANKQVGSSFEYPLNNYLPSTWEKIKNETRLRSRYNNNNSPD